MARKLSSVYAIIDLDCKNENVLALSSLLQRPLVKVDNIDEETPHKYALSVRPSYRDVCDALFDMIKFYSFTKVAVVYDGKNKYLKNLMEGSDKFYGVTHRILRTPPQPTPCR